MVVGEKEVEVYVEVAGGDEEYVKDVDEEEEYDVEDVERDV